MSLQLGDACAYERLCQDGKIDFLLVEALEDVQDLFAVAVTIGAGLELEEVLFELTHCLD